MAMLIKIANDYDTYEALHNVVSYIVKGAAIVGGQNLVLHSCIEQMMTIKKIFNKTDGKMLHHFVLTLSLNDYISYEDLFWASYQICSLLPDYQIIFGVHLNSDYFHVHFCINTVSIVNGKKLQFKNAILYGFLENIRRILTPYKIPCGFSTEISTNEFQFHKAFEEINKNYI